MTETDTFCFACHRHLACFNACCRRLHQALTPYDVLRLRHHLSMGSDDFFRRYAVLRIGPATGLPVAELRFSPADGTCPFVTPDGCSVYPHRPGSCRLYPLARGLQRDPETGRIQTRYALIKEAHCRGHGQGACRSIDQWMEDQHATTYNRYNDQLMAVVTAARQTGGRSLTGNQQAKAEVLMYRIDTLDDRIGQPGWPQGLPAAARGSGLEADTSRLAFALQWLASELAMPAVRRPARRATTGEDSHDT